MRSFYHQDRLGTNTHIGKTQKQTVFLQYKTPQGSVIVAAVTEKARALAQVMKEQNATAATTKPKSKDNAKKKTA